MMVAMVMPDTGFDDVPMMPTMRLDTVTKKKPKTTTSSPVSSDPGKAPGRLGSRATIATMATEPPTTTDRGRSRSVRLRDATAALPTRRSPDRIAEAADDGR